MFFSICQEWHQKCSHYFILTASRGSLTAQSLLVHPSGAHWIHLIFLPVFYLKSLWHDCFCFTSQCHSSALLGAPLASSRKQSQFAWKVSEWPPRCWTEDSSCSPEAPAGPAEGLRVESCAEVLMAGDPYMSHPQPVQVSSSEFLAHWVDTVNQNLWFPPGVRRYHSITSIAGGVAVIYGGRSSPVSPIGGLVKVSLHLEGSPGPEDVVELHEEEMTCTGAHPPLRWRHSATVVCHKGKLRAVCDVSFLNKTKNHIVCFFYRKRLLVYLWWKK